MRVTVLFVLGLVIATSVWTLTALRRQSENQVRSVLEALLATTVGELQIWIDNNKSSALARSQIPAIVRAIETQNRLRTNVKRLKSSPTLKLLDDFNMPIVTQRSYVSYFVLSLNGTLIAGTDKKRIGQPALELIGPAASNLKSLQKTVKLVSPFYMSLPQSEEAAGQSVSKKIVMAITAPVFDHFGHPIAIFGFHIDPEGEFSKVTLLSRVGKTGETYVFDQDGRIITTSRFETHLSLNNEDRPLKSVAKNAIKQRFGIDIKGYKDYRGEKVIGAWTWNKDLGFGVITEVDYTEAYALIERASKLVGFLLCFIFAIVALAMGILMKRNRILAHTIRELEDTEANLQDSLKIRDQFISLAAHELRTPLTPINTQIHLLNSIVNSGRLTTYPLEKLKALLATSQRSFSRIWTLVNMMLDAAQIESNEFNAQGNVRTFDLSSVVRKVIANMSPEFTDAGCILETEIDDPIVGHLDADRFEQIISNILGNAAKFGAKNTVQVKLKKSEETVIFSVRDHGPGLTEEQQVEIFDRFWRGFSEKNYGGLGLGLFISKNIAEAYGGTIRVESHRGEGTLFTVTLPLESQQRAPNAA